MFQSTKNYIDKAVCDLRIALTRHIGDGIGIAIEEGKRLDRRINNVRDHVDTQSLKLGCRLAAIEQHQRGYLNAKASLRLDDDIQQHVQDQKRQTLSRELLKDIQPYDGFTFGDRVKNVKTDRFLHNVTANGAPESFLRTVRYMTTGTIIPRPDGCPVFAGEAGVEANRQVYVLCDDGKVRSTRAGFLRVIRSRSVAVDILRFSGSYL
jgi:hypothetical protein